MFSNETIRRIFSNVSGSSFVGIDTLTSVKLGGGKKNPAQGRITKYTKGSSVMVFQNQKSSAYGDMVSRRLTDEGKSKDDFVLRPRVWGKRISHTPFVAHHEKLYLEVIFLKAGEVTYLLDNKPIEKDKIEGLPTPNTNALAQGGLENRVIIRTFKIENITAIRIDKKEYQAT